MHCRITTPHKFRTRLGFRKYDVIVTKEQSVLTKIKSSFEEQNTMQTQCSVLHFHDYILAIEIDENYHSDRKSYYKIHYLVLLHTKTMQAYCVRCKKKKILRTKTLVSQKLNKID